jgi:serine/threonine-protein kinase RsbW
MVGMTSLPASGPHPGATELHQWTLDSFGELRRLRAALMQAVGETTDPERNDVFDRIAVVATELATNALRHGLPPTVVRLLREDERLIIDVADHDPDAAPRLDENRPLGKGGLGLQLTRNFATDVGWYFGDDTKHVWASFPH